MTPAPALDLTTSLRGDFLHPFLSHLAVSGTEGVSVHHIPKPVNKVEGHGRCRTVGEKGGVMGLHRWGVRQGGGLAKGVQG